MPRITRKQIEDLLPQKRDFLFPQTAEYKKEDGRLKTAKGKMRITKKNPYLPLHFNVFPGNLTMEFFSQVAAVAVMAAMKVEGYPVLVQISEARFGMVPVFAGSKLTAEIEMVKHRGRADYCMFYMEGVVRDQYNEKILEAKIVGSSVKELPKPPKKSHTKTTALPK